MCFCNRLEMKKSTIGWIAAGVLGFGAILGAGNDKPSESKIAGVVPQAISKKFVNTDKLNIRSFSNGKIVDKKNRGDEVLIYEVKTGWSRISKTETPSEWVISKSLCEGINCYKVTNPIEKSTVTTQTVASNYSPPKASRQERVKYNDSDCSCAVVDYCVGPRGGHYCITSGGNKRYKSR